jgi:hypothetical protein
VLDETPEALRSRQEEMRTRACAFSAVFGQSISTLVYVLLYKKWLANEKNDTAKVKMEAS